MVNLNFNYYYIMRKQLVKFFTIILIAGCQKDVVMPSAEVTHNESEILIPFEFSSLEEMQKVIMEYDSNDSATRSNSVDLLSYAETVMQEEGYAEQPYAIMSESFGSVLNPDGEVIFGEFALKLYEKGILFSLSKDIDVIRELSKNENLLNELTEANSFLFAVESLDGIYSIEGYSDVYLYDLFCLKAESENIVSQEVLDTRATELGYETSGGVYYHTYQLLNEEINQTYTIPKGNKNQRNVFSSNSKIANDTKIYHENYLVTKERGIKVKTVQKKALGWFKFKNNITAAIEGLYIAEYFTPSNVGESGWMDVHTTTYDGKSYVIATKVIDGAHNVTMSNSQIKSECDKALAWAKSQNINVSNIDGVRYISRSRKDVNIVRIKDQLRSAYDNVYTFKICLKPYGRMYSSRISLGNLVINNANYRIFGMVMSGYSEYGNEK